MWNVVQEQMNLKNSFLTKIPQHWFLDNLLQFFYSKSMSEEQVASIPESPVKKTELVFGGILIGLVFVVLSLFIFNYFRIISLSSFYSRFSMLPQRELSVEEKAKKAGYEVTWKGSTEDGSGRAIFASKERNYNGWVDKFGWSSVKIDDEFYDEYKAVGVFKGVEKINNSNDLYVIFEDPEAKNKLRARISNSENLDLNGKMTRLNIENLNYLSKKEGYYQLINNNETMEEKINQFIKPGDIITIYSMIMISEDKSSTKIYHDENKIPIVQDLIFRRFGGLVSLNDV